MEGNGKTSGMAMTADTIPKSLKPRRLGLIETIRTIAEARSDISKGAAAVDEEGRIDAPLLNAIRENATELKARYFEYCAERTARPRMVYHTGIAELERFEEKAKPIEESVEPQPKTGGRMSAAEIVDIRRRRREWAAKQSEISSAKARIEQLYRDTDKALKEIRQIEEETILAVCVVEARAYKKMDIYAAAASRKAHVYVRTPAPQDDPFPKIAEELYTFLNNDEPLPSRPLYADSEDADEKTAS